jgi:hypothetical protein
MWHAYEDVFCGFWLGCVAFMVATMGCFFFFLHVFKFMIRHPIIYVMFVNLPYIILIFIGVTYFVLCGIKSALLVSTIVMPSSHNIVVSLCCCSVNCFVFVFTILKYDCKPALNLIVKNLSVVGTCKPWANFWIRS